MKQKFIILISIIILLAFSFCNNKKSKNTSGSENLSHKADSLYTLGKTYSEDSLNQEKALELYWESFELYKQSGNKQRMATLYKRIGFAYDYSEDFSKVKEYQKKALKINTEIDNKTESAVILNYLGIAYTITGDIDSALIFYDKGLELSKITGDTAEIIEIYQNIGISYREAGNYEKAIESTVKALKYCEKINYISSIVSLNLHIAQYYNNMENTDMALSYCEKASEFIDSIDSPYTLASYYNTLGELYFVKKDYVKAAENYKKTLEICINSDYKRGMATSYSNLASIALKEQNFKEAEKYAYLSIDLEYEINHINGVIGALLELAKIQYLQKSYDKALIQIQKAENLCNEKGLYEQLPDIYYHFYQVYKLSGKQKQALKYCENYYILEDSLTGIELKEKIAEIEIKYQTEKKQHKIEVLKLNNLNQKKQITLQLLLIGLLVLSAVFIVFVFYQYRKRKAVVIEKMQNDIYEYLTQIDNISKSLSDFKSNSKVEIMNKIKEFDLTERERDVLFLIAEGNRNKEIGEKLFISLSTVKTHTTNIFYKLDVKNRIEAIRKTKFL